MTATMMVLTMVVIMMSMMVRYLSLLRIEVLLMYCVMYHYVRYWLR